MQSAGRIMRKQGEGVMINLVGADQESRPATPGKAGLLALTQAVASEFGVHHIQVNAISCSAPGGVQLAGFPADPVELVLFLCSQKTSDVHGKIIHCPLKP
jgi:NAD(P)-dependent dehydrogenase (short-subunit alcohol dehydrogenase family)